MVDDELGDDSQFAPLGLLHETPEIAHRAESGIDVPVVRDVVTVIASRTRVERQQPERRHTEIMQVIKTFGQSGKVANAIAVAVAEGLDVKLVDDGVLEPQITIRGAGFNIDVWPDVHHVGSGDAAQQKRRIVGGVDAQPRAAPLEQLALAGREIFDSADRLARDFGVAKMKPEVLPAAG